jgi:hypothetical protein
LPAIQMGAAWAGDAMYLIYSVWPGPNIYYLRYGFPTVLRPIVFSQPAWASANETVVTLAEFQSWAVDAWDMPVPKGEGPATTAVFYVDQQSGLWMVGFEYFRPFGLNLPQLLPSAPVQIDTGQWSAGQQPASLGPQQAVITNASGLWQVFFLQAGQCYRWTQSAPS